MKAYRTAMVVVTMAAAMMAAEAQEKAAPANSYFSDITRYRVADGERATKNYVACLKSSNEGIVESALAHVAMMKLASPEKEFRKLHDEVDNVAATAMSQETRYKAYLVSILIDNPAMFAAEAQASHESSDELFGSMASTLSRTLLASQQK